MAWLNYHHLLYFWTVAREGTIARACAHLHLTQPTISGQLHAFEKAWGSKLFERVGRNLVLTDTGRVVYRYADEIFLLGRELQDTLKGRPAARPLRFVVGVADTVPKELAYRLLEPALRLPEPTQIVCDHGKPDYLLAQLALNALDLVLADAPVGASAKIRAFNHLLGESGLSFMATRRLAAAYRRSFPQSLNGAPFLLPAENTVLRRSLEQWCEAEGIRPLVRGEFSDPGLLKVFGEKGAGVFAVRTAVERETQRHYKVGLVGRVESIRERFYAISVERKLKHPAVVAITEAARKELFARSL
jgi:LysR family transcriptional regulator, transcriptional activator of nhaA